MYTAVAIFKNTSVLPLKIFVQKIRCEMIIKDSTPIVPRGGNAHLRRVQEKSLSVSSRQAKVWKGIGNIPKGRGASLAELARSPFLP